MGALQPENSTSFCTKTLYFTHVDFPDERRPLFLFSQLSCLSATQFVQHTLIPSPSWPNVYRLYTRLSTMALTISQKPWRVPKAQGLPAIGWSQRGKIFRQFSGLVNSYLNTRRTVGVGESDWLVGGVARAAMLAIFITINRSWESPPVIG